MLIKNILSFNKKTLLISTLISANLFAANIDFERLEKNPQRVAPNQTKTVHLVKSPSSA